MAKFSELNIKGSWIFNSDVHGDARGFFVEWYKMEIFSSISSKPFIPVQANLSKSNGGVIRGIHFSIAPSGQAKWITCSSGSLWDVVVDIRPHSPTFLKWEANTLAAGDGKSIFISEGLGHAFMALENETTISYLLSSPYSPRFEMAINPFDPEIGIKWPKSNISLSARDQAAPLLREVLDTLIQSPHTGIN